MNLKARLFAALTAISVSATAAGNRTHDRIAKLPEPKRNEALTEFMTHSGETCEVTRSFFQGSNEKSAYWSVACTNNMAFAIVLNADGSSAVTECKRLKELSHVECFKPRSAE